MLHRGVVVFYFVTHQLPHINIIFQSLFSIFSSASINNYFSKLFPLYQNGWMIQNPEKTTKTFLFDWFLKFQNIKCYVIYTFLHQVEGLGYPNHNLTS